MISSKPCFSSSVEREKKLSPLLAARTILQCIVSSGSAILAESRVTLSISQQPPLFSHLANIKMGIYYPLTNFRVKCPSSTCQWTMSVAFIFPWTISFPAIVSQCMAWLDRFFLFVCWSKREMCKILFVATTNDSYHLQLGDGARPPLVLNCLCTRAIGMCSGIPSEAEKKWKWIKIERGLLFSISFICQRQHTTMDYNEEQLLV